MLGYTPSVFETIFSIHPLIMSGEVVSLIEDDANLCLPMFIQEYDIINGLQGFMFSDD